MHVQTYNVCLYRHMPSLDACSYVQADSIRTQETPCVHTGNRSLILS